MGMATPPQTQIGGQGVSTPIHQRISIIAIKAA